VDPAAPALDARGQPYGRWVLLSTRGEEDTMAAPVSRPVQRHARQWSRLWWLPAGGYGNGLDDGSWVPVLDVGEQVVPRVLAVLRDAGVPATQRWPARHRTGCGSGRDGPRAISPGPAPAHSAGRRWHWWPRCRPLPGRRPAVPTAHGG